MIERKLKDDEFVEMAGGLFHALAPIAQEHYALLAELYQKPFARIKSVDMTYRALNYLSSTGLFPEKREQDGKGWRELSFVECVYLTLVIELRHYGVKINTLRRVYNAFIKAIDPKDATVFSCVWLDALAAIQLCHTEVYLFVGPDGTIKFCDAGYAMFYLKFQKKSSAIIVPLSNIVNKFLEKNGREPFAVKFDIFYDGLQNSERRMILESRKLDDNEKLEYTKKKNGGLITTSHKVDEKILKELSSLVDGDFGSIKAVKEGGKVVSAQKEVKSLVIND